MLDRTRGYVALELHDGDGAVVVERFARHVQAQRPAAEVVGALDRYRPVRYVHLEGGRRRGLSG